MSEIDTAPDLARDVHPSRWRILALLATAELLGMSLWFAASAIAPQLQHLWHLSASETGWLTAIVQLGFVAGTAAAALLNLADVISSRAYFAGAAALGALVNAALLIVPGYRSALVLRFATGFCLAGVYPPAMKMISTWFRSQRGLAIGTIVGALTVGKATPYLVHALEGAGIAPVILVASAAALASALLVASGYRDGPFSFTRRPFSWSLVGTVVREREWRQAVSGYLGHMWELYSFWTWIPAFFAASAAGRRAAGLSSPSTQAVGLLAFSAIAIGGLGCVWGGWVADRIGYERLVTRAMAVSGCCALLIGSLFGARFEILVPLAWVWGISVIADSAQFSTLVTQSVPPHAVGTALTLQTSLGFLLTTVSIQLVPRMVDAVGWRWAFAFLALGPAFGIAAIRRLQLSKVRVATTIAA
ncbi:MAG TPA: MFS transporter [Gemmatimonadaceae bacterium]|nr:MFS transporter [Gemmatimonadaceae bacterium]